MANRNSTMQTANIMLALGGDKGTTVPKYGVTPAEIAVLQTIHGADAVHEIEPGETVQRSDREEIERLMQAYGTAKINTGNGEVLVVTHLFPGLGARVYSGLDELDLDESLFKAIERVKPTKMEEADDEEEDEPKPAKKTRKAKAKAETKKTEGDSAFD